MNEIIKINDLYYRYRDGNREKVIFENLSISFEQGKFYSILGDSGSGKTSFLYLLAGLDKAQKGEIYFLDKNLNDINLNQYRRENIAIIFQDYNLIPYMNVLNNLKTAIDISSSKAEKNDIDKVMDLMNLKHDILFQKVNKLSGGEKQRVAIARALLCDADIILADEPTGNLDSRSGQEVVELFKMIKQKFNKTIIMVTHNETLAQYADTIYFLDQNTKKFIKYESLK